MTIRAGLLFGHRQVCILLDEIFGKLVDLNGMFVRLPAEFVSGEVILLVMGDGRDRVGVGSKVVQLCDSIVRTLWHSFLGCGLDLATACLHGRLLHYVFPSVFCVGELSFFDLTEHYQEQCLPVWSILVAFIKRAEEEPCAHLIAPGRQWQERITECDASRGEQH
jgi:hypothetical protein